MARVFNRYRWVPVLLAGLFAAFVGVAAYNLGVSHGLAQNWPASAGAVPPWGWYRPWGFGFGIFPLFFIVFWIFIVRAIFWGGPWRRGYYRPRHWYRHAYDDGAMMFDEWHRRAHERERDRDRGAAPTTDF
jgi:hypothetical protein